MVVGRSLFPFSLVIVHERFVYIGRIPPAHQDCPNQGHELGQLTSWLVYLVAREPGTLLQPPFFRNKEAVTHRSQIEYNLTILLRNCCCMVLSCFSPSLTVMCS
ncbi:hypothetical protein KC19_7G029800 [Ceratodon purpureus]|uniref:Uncharacterized protein n=1 Tax=Ceratodon purpureus TaxID=3225 RepID=A0A8T0H6I7_CERPU|nr:hypothetical protein KC19_7G029800 [Ceratodon purpureus]